MRRLDQEAIDLFARKGLDRGTSGPVVAEGAPQLGESNAVKVRRVMQLTADLGGAPVDRLKILDVGCGEGVYSIEAGLQGAAVTAIDVRDERMRQGAQVAERHGLDRIEFRREDALSIDPETHGRFDVVWALGVLYHLDLPELLELLRRLRAVCTGTLIADSVVSLSGPEELSAEGRAYRGERFREHEDDDPPEVRRSRLLRSLENTFAVKLTRGSLASALADSGFTSVLDCSFPAEPGKAEDRVTLAALAGEPVELGTYPWINGLDDEAIADRLEA